MNNIRNFCIIAHIDHGKSTLADRFLELTGTLNKREMKHEQMLDTMELEQEKGITIKLQPVRMIYHPPKNNIQYSILNIEYYILNLIDTPGHVDFTYEVSRSLAAVEGALLLVDATQGIQAQTLSNLYLAMEQNLVIIPVINKIDLPNAEIAKVQDEMIHLLGCRKEDILLTSAKTGIGVEEILQKVIELVPPPKSDKPEITQALIFDSSFDEYRGVVAYVRLFNGQIKKGDKIHLCRGGLTSEALEVGYFHPKLKPEKELNAGEIGYVITGLKEIDQCRVGDTITVVRSSNEHPPISIALPGYKEVKPMVFAGFFCAYGDDFPRLREALARLRLSDAALTYQPEQSSALGFGFRCGFLGLLHLEIIQERLKREFDLPIVITTPSVAYLIRFKEKIKDKNLLHKQKDYWNEIKDPEREIMISSPADLPNQSLLDLVAEPWMKLDIVTPETYLGAVMKLVQEYRGVYLNTEYLDFQVGVSARQIVLHYEIPLASLLVDFYDNLKSATSGYASMNYDFLDYRKCDVVRLDILVAEDEVEALAAIVYRDEAFRVGKRVVETLKKSLPRQQFVVKLQAAVNGKILASERISAFRKDVTAKLYGGDVTRKEKLLKKQKEGKKKMMARGKGRVEIPQDVFVKLLRK